MSKQTYFVALPFIAGKRGRLAEGEPVMAASASQAIRAAERLLDRHAGAVAFSRTGDPDTGDWEDAVILAEAGQVPKAGEEAA